MDVFDPFLPIYDVNNGPRFKTTKDDRDWVSVGPSSLDLDLVDPSKRFSASHFSIASPYHAWPEGDIWWAGWIPTSRLEGHDILAWLLPAAPDNAILPTEQRYVVNEEWKGQANAIAPRVSLACSLVVKAVPSVFERYLHGRKVPCLPSEYTEGSLEGEEFDSATDGRAYLATFADEILVNLGFLGWFMTCVPRWDKLLAPEVAAFVNELRLPEREKRGFLLDLPLDWPAMDLKFWYENKVPFHYMWTEEAAAQPRFTQLNPSYIKHHRRLAR
ncbi:uncharacterized protein SCHCODRAFT_02705844 [Schizophyllum commune H4-8]|uniref:Uncharacterized protein n=1 Tax=Schizophyllum commune (strain H4-8 / FGSC 9210) TaxID=578458 RepID=D8QHX8_SCHCM|nr:uncharacterized protein SCHCODRAFT_02705844 [Schizophyllum commune H4-8]KAI5887372.1 hypothetical protein SCHCODRAFT_02705844 [Schizophyllum commune H4-8]